MTRPACEGCDTDYWFSNSPTERAYALSICNRCPIKRECLDRAIHAEAQGQVDDRHVVGIFGGLTARERLELIVPVCQRCQEPRPRGRWYCDPCAEVARREARDRHDAKRRMERAA